MIRLLLVRPADIYSTLLVLLPAPRLVSQLLFCKPTTTKYELETFVLRALLDPHNRPYIFVELSKLPNKIQIHLEQILENLLHECPQITRLKICILDQALKNQRIYSYLAANKSLQVLR